MDQAIQNQINILRDIIVQTVPVEQIYLFGSYAYGTPTPDSDLDLYVIMKNDAPLPALEAEQKISLARFRSGFRTLPADIFVLKKSRFQRRLTAPTLEQEVSKKGIVIYDFSCKKTWSKSRDTERNKKNNQMQSTKRGH